MIFLRVFRCITADEITNMYQNNPKRNPILKGQNTHQYLEDTDYIHFFRYSKSALYFYNYFRVAMGSKDRHIAYMIANIPNDILDKNLGYGYYSNYERMPGLSIVPEYAIPISEFNPEYVVEVNNYIVDKYMNDEEHMVYIKLLDKLQKKFNYNDKDIQDFLLKNKLQELLQVKDDDRDEKQIQDEEIDQIVKEFNKHFPNGVYD